MDTAIVLIGEAMKKFQALVSGAVLVLGLAGLAAVAADGGDTQPPAATQPTTEQSAVDLHNTVCPVSGDDVGTSKLTETYEGKIYHFCCDDCPAKFKKDPDKFAKLVAANPEKYGVKQ
jgi:YHS domain-containing protein